MVRRSCVFIGLLGSPSAACAVSASGCTELGAYLRAGPHRDDLAPTALGELYETWFRHRTQSCRRLLLPLPQPLRFTPSGHRMQLCRRYHCHSHSRCASRCLLRRLRPRATATAWSRVASVRRRQPLCLRLVCVSRHCKSELDLVEMETVLAHTGTKRRSHLGCT